MKYAANPNSTVQNVAQTLQYTSDHIRMRRQLQWRAFFIALAVLDLVLVYAAFQISFYIRFHTSLAIFVQDVIPQTKLYEGLSLFLLPIWLMLFAGFGLYNRANTLQGTREAQRLFSAATVCAILLIAVDFLYPSILLARGWVIVTWLMSFMLVGIGRYLTRLVVRGMRGAGYLVTPALIVGANAEGILLAEQLYRAKYSGLQIIGFVDDTLHEGAAVTGGLKNLGGVDAINELVDRFGVEEIIISSSALQQDQIVHLFERFGFSGETNIRLSSGLYQIITTGLQVNEFSGVPLVQINRVRLTGADQFAKNLMDYLIAVPATLILLPVFAILAAAVRLDSPGPVIHRRRVMGVNGSRFDAFKFRTMRVDGDAILAEHPELQEELRVNGKLKDDPRVTRVGNILRKTSLDELPQLINVLRKEMSIVGPRMISPPEMANYRQNGMNLLTVRPGITGLWQVSGRSDVSYEERVRLDMYYIRNWSVWFDVQIILRTIPAVLQRRGAY